ncbi:diacylglycerol kinase family protein [Turicibacter sp. H121]|uniref:diacylglycerol kinase family protein n=1 Tax=Turicibacter sp. H121 TaxID=1712675 RepID=UPI0007631331|nr:diacylglycerol kinase family protein [Turicibacter sp. H121]AMC09156.1 UDP kinase [Turicibacter sp. H121]MCU7200032.1 diacylglycerol kinase family protein [Turicibacter sp. H121]
MRSEFDVKEEHSVKALIKSFQHAFCGILTSFVIGRNIKVHYTAALAAVLSGLSFGISKVELVIILLISAQVICLEMVNTAIERTVDLVTSEYHIYAKIAKDVAAGAVLVAAIFATIIGGIIFLPYIFK